ncbi:MAG: hypothetical protein A2Z47_14680 [Thermodesulfovibrio sp. RBG_19FT_COMBO_42_12]|nr:MAG: hypothetical protein A2Z47_14680 [Thermodesulfovibrio sp. RBG_19FT_COMBO_42_12]
MDARLKTPDYKLRGQASGMTKECYIRSQLTVNSKDYFIIEFKCASILHLRVSISNIFATDGFTYGLISIY